MNTESGTRVRRRRFVVCARATATTSSAASTIAREWVEQHGGRARVVELRPLGLRRRLEQYGPGRRTR